MSNSFRFGRKKTTVAFMTMAGLSIVAVSFIPAGTDNTGKKQFFIPAKSIREARSKVFHSRLTPVADRDDN